MSTITAERATYTLRYEGGYIAKATEVTSNAFHVIATASNGDTSPVWATVAQAERWIARHYHNRVTGHGFACACL
ncbi:hypothetical protein [Nocardioides sp.]|uniref:hypothetical protein n=1 Tax=Nocardioides sp. TaxID=35761 RepID=UPI0039E4B34A